MRERAETLCGGVQPARVGGETASSTRARGQLAVTAALSRPSPSAKTAAPRTFAPNFPITVWSAAVARRPTIWIFQSYWSLHTYSTGI
jgi:hypothetical protein